MSLPLIKELLPPGSPVTRWRWLIAIAVTALVVNGLAGRGALGSDFAFASQKEQQQQGEKIDRILKLQIAATLRDLRKQECTANGNKTLILATIEDYQEDYKELNGGVRYPLPPCDDHG